MGSTLRFNSWSCCSESWRCDSGTTTLLVLLSEIRPSWYIRLPIYDAGTVSTALYHGAKGDWWPAVLIPWWFHCLVNSCGDALILSKYTYCIANRCSSSSESNLPVFSRNWNKSLWSAELTLLTSAHNLNALVVHTAASNKAASIWLPVGNHVSCYINVFHPLNASNPGRDIKRLYSLLKILENGICFVISEALKINNDSAASINAPMENESPLNKFMVRANVPQMIWIRHVVGPSTDCVCSSHSSPKAIYPFQTFSDSGPLNIYSPPFQTASNIGFPTIWC